MLNNCICEGSFLQRCPSVGCFSKQSMSVVLQLLHINPVWLPCNKCGSDAVMSPACVVWGMTSTLAPVFWSHAAPQLYIYCSTSCLRRNEDCENEGCCMLRVLCIELSYAALQPKFVRHPAHSHFVGCGAHIMDCLITTHSVCNIRSSYLC